MREPYETDLTDDQWAVLQPLIPPARRGGAPRTTDIREVLNAIFYIEHGGSPWRLLPHDFPPWQTVFDYFNRWRVNGTWRRLNEALRRRVRAEHHPGHGVDPQTARLDSQSVKSAGQRAAVGVDGGKRVKGRKRHIAVDSLGLLLAVVVTAANVDDARAAPAVLRQLPASVRAVYADSKYHNYRLYGYIGGTKADYSFHIVSRPPGTKGWVTLPRRWVVERTFGWLRPSRRHSRDYEKTPESSEAFIYVRSIKWMLNRLRPRPEGFPSRAAAA